MNENELMRKASEDVAKILYQLEKDSGLIVDTIELQTMDVSAIGG